MIKLLFLLYINTFLLSGLYALPIIELDTSDVKVNDFQLEYFVDHTGEMSFAQIVKQPFLKSRNKASLGHDSRDVWLRFKITNTGKEKKHFYLYNELAYLSYAISYLELENHRITREEHFNMNNLHHDSPMLGADAVFPIVLDVNQSKSIYIKNRVLDYQFFNIALYDNENAMNRVQTKQVLVLMVLGMLIALMFYHLLLFISTGYRAYLYYSLYLLSGLIWELQLTGTLANLFGFYYNESNEFILLFVLVVPIFLMLFTKSIFETKEKFVKENIWLNLVLIVFIVGILIGFNDIVFALQKASYMYIYMFIVLLAVTVSIYKKGNPFAGYFLLGNGFFLLMTFINDLFYLGLIPYTWLSFNGALVGILIESLTLAFILAYRIKLLQESEIEKTKVLVKQEELEKLNTLLEQKIEEAVEDVKSKDKLIQQRARHAQMGEMINMIAHQWRQPLGAVSAVTVGIRSKMHLGKYDLEQHEGREQFIHYLNDKLTSIQVYIKMMTDTIEDFRSFFIKTDDTKMLSINSVVKKALSLMETSFQKNNIQIIQKLESQREIALYENEIVQVILNILQNSQDVFEERQIEDRVINIMTYDRKNQVIVELSDNGKGISGVIFDRIFDPYFSTKPDKQGTGIGLYISKMIMEQHHHGILEVSNNDTGVSFILRFPHLKD